MSHRVTTQTQIRDKSLAVSACKAANITFTEYADTLSFTSGALRGASLNLKTGVITGDTDYGHSVNKLNEIKMYYGEAMYRQECNRRGIMIEERSINKDGEIVLISSYG